MGVPLWWEFYAGAFLGLDSNELVCLLIELASLAGSRTPQTLPPMLPGCVVDPCANPPMRRSFWHADGGLNSERDA
ncbi:hypothetical protein ACLOJK_032557 [Asimina triloba]